MLNKDKLEKLMALLGEVADDQKALLAEALNGSINEKALFEKLGVDEGKFAEFMKVLAGDIEEQVLGQELSPDEMEAIAGGYKDGIDCDSSSSANCKNWNIRNIYEGGFPNCASTVEDGSWCGENDACWASAVAYKKMKDCNRAWK